MHNLWVLYTIRVHVCCVVQIFRSQRYAALYIRITGVEVEVALRCLNVWFCYLMRRKITTRADWHAALTPCARVAGRAEEEVAHVGGDMPAYALSLCGLPASPDIVAEIRSSDTKIKKGMRSPTGLERVAARFIFRSELFSAVLLWPRRGPSPGIDRRPLGLHPDILCRLWHNSVNPTNHTLVWSTVFVVAVWPKVLI